MDSSALDAAFRLTVGAIFLLLLPALFSGSETALNAASRGKLRAQADKGSAGATEALSRLLKKCRSDSAAYQNPENPSRNGI
jgi:Mg2+/Co2+ transporter CorB